MVGRFSWSDCCIYSRLVLSHEVDICLRPRRLLSLWCVGRYLFREYSESLIEKFKSFRAVDHVLGSKGLQIMLLLRLSPVVPFTFFNYLAGATACSFRDYALGTLIGKEMVLGTLPPGCNKVLQASSQGARYMSLLGLLYRL